MNSRGEDIRGDTTDGGKSTPVRDESAAAAHPVDILTRDSLNVLSLAIGPIWVFDLDQHRVWWANAAAVRFWGADSEAELLARAYERDSGTTRRRLRQIFESTPPGRAVQDNWTLYPDGRPTSVAISLTPIRIRPEGAPALLIQLVSQFDDQDTGIDRRMVEASRYTALMISIFDMDGALLSMNPAAQDTFDRSEPLIARFVDQEEGRQMLDACREGRESKGEYHAMTCAGQCWHRIDMKIGYDPVSGGRCIIAVEEDISALKDALTRLETLNRTLEEKVEERTLELDFARRRAEEANNAKSEFLASMSHDLRTPLNAILGFSEILASPETQGMARDRYQEYGQDIHKAAAALLLLVDDLLDLSRIEAGRTTMDMEEADVAMIMRDCVTMIGPTVAGKGLTLAVDLPVGLKARTDVRAVAQIGANLLSNAAKFTPVDGRIDVTARRDDADNCIVVTIADSGIGIPKEDLRRVFEPYRRGRTDIARTIQGTGLGLAICRRLADLLNARLDIESEPGTGTTVTLRLPIEGTESSFEGD
ncbi:PAS domain-containing sensor histidine kinase [Rhodospirillaceae bacterium KN72]|uniref:histidine kinase n=1 Tax=Pacificispira spongiicola TaxID=2729598 RepID=A0A7Y0E282_9PROT|nr:PAS domain-containing sensor histidine kinase [Pacificispira spongiicola]NMM45897.1 PAS domain-containing sensor histidine kinase [Pacificispira spongiicola]